MILYDYPRSSAAYRVRIALNLKGFEYRQMRVNLLQAEQRSATHYQRNPQGLVPVLDDRGHCLSQSLAICEYLDEAYPDTVSLLPAEPLHRARARAMAQLIACDIHPLNNLRVLTYLQGELGIGDEAKQQWYQHWIREGFTALEQQLEQRSKAEPFCFDGRPGLVELCLVPQLYNARRFAVDISDFPHLTEIAAACESLPAFQQAHPDQQSEQASDVNG